MLPGGIQPKLTINVAQVKVINLLKIVYFMTFCNNCNFLKFLNDSVAQRNHKVGHFLEATGNYFMLFSRKP